jgi:hypothetical protein
MPAPPTGNWAWPVKKVPSFKTIIQTPASNRGEVRLALAQYPIWKFEYDFSYLKGDYQTAGAMQNLIGFYGNVQGCAQDWLFSDPYDNAVLVGAPAVFGYGDGVTTQFQLLRTVAGMSDLIQNLNGNPVVYVNAAQQQQIGVFVGSASYPFWYGLENLLLQSQALGTSPWFTGAANGGTAPTVTNNDGTAPDSSNSSTLLAFPATPGSEISSVSQALANISIAGQTVCFSVWLRVASGTASITLGLSDGVAEVNFAAVTVTTTWTRFNVTMAFDSFASSVAPYVTILSNGQASAENVYAWGAQFERNQAGPSGYLLNTTATSTPSGVIKFVNAPPAGSKLTWSGNFYHRCRFDEDELSDMSEFLYQIWECKSLKFRSVLL